MANGPQSVTFDLLNSPCDGTNLIEASAGTGKTYAIAGLFLRLLLEQDLLVNEILVVTFTDAATNELKERIQRRLREALAWISGDGPADPFLAALCSRQPPAGHASRRLRGALNDFDQASIFTIHGFCQRVLRDHAFESGMMFDADLVADQERFVREIVHDFWRNHFYRASPRFLDYAFAHGINPGSFSALLGKNLTNPYLTVIPQQDIPDCSSQEAEFQACFETLRQAWFQARDEVQSLLTTTEGLHRGRYRKDRIPGWIEAMDAFFAGDGLGCILPEVFEKFTTGGLRAATRKGCRHPSHPVFDLCEAMQAVQQALVDQFNRVLLGLRLKFIETVRLELAERKRDRNTLFFDDLLLMLEGALRGPGGEHLAAVVRNRFQAALIDEFQDTDAIQYAIFERIFGRGKSTLFLIGDPKQAIYGFRGADIFTYLYASRQVSRRFTLGENWRSEPALIQAVNTVFRSAKNAFVYEDIAFQPVNPAPKERHERLAVDGRPALPLQIWLMEADKHAEAAPISRRVLEEVVPRAVAGEVSQLLTGSGQGAVTLGDRPLRPGDLAVLVRRNAEARLVQAALADLGIHAVLYDIGNLFDSHEALEVERLLVALLEPADAKLLKVALTTTMLGVTGEELVRLLQDEAAWEAWLIRFGDYHELWRRHGFFRMFRCLLRQEAVLPRLMALVEGERRCTNVLHLAEVLHQAAVDNHLGMVGLVKWLAAHRDAAAPHLEEHQLRLESDENAVKIATIHKSKGMEYPIVFCPFLGDRSTLRIKDEGVVFHDQENAGRLTIDLGSPMLDEHVRQAQKEQLAENLRLLYVTMTRAKHRCTLVWGRFRDAGTAAPAYLFHQPREAAADDLPDAVASRYATLQEGELRDDLRQLEANAAGSIAVLELPVTKGVRQPTHDEASGALRCRPFEVVISRDWSISSFSSLVSSQPRRADWADRDDSTPTGIPGEEADKGPPTAPRETLDMFSFPRGTSAGAVLHDLFEHLDFTERDDNTIQALIAAKLKAHGFEDRWVGAVYDMVRRVLEVPLTGEPDGLRLQWVPPADRLNELEFYFPLQRLSGSRLREVFGLCLGSSQNAAVPSAIERLQFRPLEGFMKGFMDLVFRFGERFYLVDWKSNFLGSRLDDYAQEALQKAMTEHFYHLQYHLYVVAIHKYLAARLPGYRYDSHFGGVFYLFLRGVDPVGGSAYGIYRHRPSEATIEALCQKLIGSARP